MPYAMAKLHRTKIFRPISENNFRNSNCTFKIFGAGYLKMGGTKFVFVTLNDKLERKT